MKAEAVKSEKTTIAVVENTTFEGDMKTNIVSTIEMADIVSTLFSPAFADYYGCAIRISDGSNNTMPIGTIYVDIYFKDKGNNFGRGIKNLELRGQVKNNAADNNGNGTTNLAARYDQVNKMNNKNNSGRVYDVTKETYEALEEFMTVRNINWDLHTQEFSTNMGILGTKEEAVVRISGLSLDKILTKIYGSDTDEGKFEYNARYSVTIPGRNNEFIMQVCQLNLAAVRKLNRELGVNNVVNPQFHVYH